MAGDFYYIFPTPPHEDRKVLERLNHVLTALEGVKTKMATIHDDIGILKAEVVNLFQIVTAGLANIADNLTTSSEKADVENSVAQLKQIENAVLQATANITTPPAGDPPPADIPPPPVAAPPTLVDPSVLASLRASR